MPLASEFTKPMFDFLNIDRMKVIVDGMNYASSYGDDSSMEKEIFYDFYAIYQEFMEEHVSDYEDLFRRIETLNLHDNEKSRSRNYFLGKLEDIINESFIILLLERYVLVTLMGNYNSCSHLFYPEAKKIITHFLLDCLFIHIR